jgi:Uma2 family endonuclease
MSPTLLDPAPNARTLICPLENGDRLTRGEFERRWDAMPEIKQAELIEGIVYMPSPVRYDQHGRPHSLFQAWTTWYEAETPGVEAADNTSIRLDLENMPQPDTVLRILAECGGQSLIDADGYLSGGPELAGEIAASTSSMDLHHKLHVYRRHRVREYVVWRVLDEALDWFVLRSGNYEPLAPGNDGVYRSEIFPGLWLDPPALIGRDAKRILEVLRLGMATEEHASFVKRLNRDRPQQ